MAIRQTLIFLVVFAGLLGVVHAETYDFGPFTLGADFDTVKVGDKLYIQYVLPGYNALQEEIFSTESATSEFLFYGENESEQNITSTTYQTVGDFTFTSDGIPGSSHFLIGSAELTGDSTSDAIKVRTVVDGVPVSEALWVPKDADADYQSVGIHALEFLPAGQHNVQVQVAAEAGATVSIRRLRFLAFRVIDAFSKSVDEVREVSTSDYSDVASFVFTPEFEGDYALFVSGLYKSSSATETVAQRTTLDGGILTQSRFEPSRSTTWKPFISHTVQELTPTQQDIGVEALCTSGTCSFKNLEFSAVRLTNKFPVSFSNAVSQVSTTSQLWQNITSLTVNKLAGQTYVFGASGTHWTTLTNAQSAMRVVVNGTSRNEVICEHIQEPKEVDSAKYDIFPFVCVKSFALDPLPTGNHTFTLQYRVNPGSGGTPTAYARFGRIFSLHSTVDTSHDIKDTNIYSLKGSDRDFPHVGEVEVCVDLKRLKGNPNVVLAIDSYVYPNISFTLNDSLETRCVTIDESDDSQDWFETHNVPFPAKDHYFGVQCLNCSTANVASIGISGFIDSSSYRSSDGGSTWIQEPREYTIDARVRMIPENRNFSLYAHEIDEGLNETLLATKNNSVNSSTEVGLEVYPTEYAGAKHFYIRESGGDNFTFVDVYTYAWLPDAEELLASLNLRPQGVVEAELGRTVVHEWTYQSLSGLNFTLGACTVYHVTDDLNFTLINITPYDLDAGDAFVSVKWTANESIINESNNYATQCTFNVSIGVGSKKTSYFYDDLRQFVYINKEKSIWEQLIDIWNKLIGIEQTVNETNILAEEINLTTTQLKMDLQMPTGHGYSGSTGTVVARFFGGDEYVSGANCSVDVLNPDGSQYAASQMTDDGNGTYTYDLTLPGTPGAYATSAVCSYQGNTVSRSGTFQVGDPVRMEVIA